MGVSTRCTHLAQTMYSGLPSRWMYLEDTTVWCK